MDIMGAPSEQRDVVLRKLIEKGPMVSDLFVDYMFPALWEEAQRYGIDPVVMVAQSGKETNWGKFTGNVKDWFYNTAGIKVSPSEQKFAPGVTDGDNPLAHERFASWTMGARAHAQHLRAYCGAHVPADEVVHPRYFAVMQRIKTVEALSGKWAPSPSYGSENVAIARTLVEVGQ